MFNTKEYTALGSIMDVFRRENLKTHCYVLSYNIDLHFYEYKLAIGVDELDHCDKKYW